MYPTRQPPPGRGVDGVSWAAPTAGCWLILFFLTCAAARRLNNFVSKANLLLITGAAPTRTSPWSTRPIGGQAPNAMCPRVIAQVRALHLPCLAPGGMLTVRPP